MFSLRASHGASPTQAVLICVVVTRYDAGLNCALIRMAIMAITYEMNLEKKMLSFNAFRVVHHVVASQAAAADKTALDTDNRRPCHYHPSVD